MARRLADVVIHVLRGCQEITCTIRLVLLAASFVVRSLQTR